MTVSLISYLRFADFKGKKFGASGTFKKGNPKFQKDKKFDNKSADTAATTEKKDWNQLKKDKKELKLKRKQTNKADLFELTVQGKKIYEKLKWWVLVDWLINGCEIIKLLFYNSKETPERNVLAKELHTLLKGEQNYQKLVLAHDTARVVQCLLKFAPAEIKREISEVF